MYYRSGLHSDELGAALDTSPSTAMQVHPAGNADISRSRVCEIFVASDKEMACGGSTGMAVAFAP